jgi:alpha-tubulin suppressor-like RCC1 family protein
MEKKSLMRIRQLLGVIILMLFFGCHIQCGTAEDYENFDPSSEIHEPSIPEIPSRKIVAVRSQTAVIVEGKVKRVCVPCKEGEIIPEPRELPGINNAVDISGGWAHACVLLTDGTIKCYGNNRYGQLGNGTFDHSLIPVTVLGINNAIQIDTGLCCSCALLADRTIKCWGLVDRPRNYPPIGETITNPVPVDVGVQNAVKVETFANTVYTLLKNGTIKAWGSNQCGQLGNGTWDDSLTPVTVLSIHNAKDIKSTGNSACALLKNGTVKCWGRGWLLGNCDPNFSDSNVPTQVCHLERVKALYSSQANYCALSADGIVKCWGANGYCLLGPDKFMEYNYPVQKNFFDNTAKDPMGTDIISLSMNAAKACALRNDGTVFCWGCGSSSRPKRVSGIENAIDLELGGVIPYHLPLSRCALLSDGNVQCWNYRHNFIFDINED